MLTKKKAKVVEQSSSSMIFSEQQDKVVDFLSKNNVLSFEDAEDWCYKDIVNTC